MRSLRRHTRGPVYGLSRLTTIATTMAHIRLRDTDEYELRHEEQDVRGWVVRDATGKSIGRVEDMIVDTDEERVASLVLNDGTSIPASDIFIGENAVYLEEVVDAAEIRPVAEVYDEFGTVRRIG